MKAVLLSKEYLDYESKKTGKKVQGWAVTYMKSRRKKSDTFSGYEVDNFFVRDNDDNELIIEQLVVMSPGDSFEAIFDVDGRYSYLEELIPGDSKFFDFSKKI